MSMFGGKKVLDRTGSERKNKSFLKDDIFKEPGTVTGTPQILVILNMIIQSKRSIIKYLKKLF